MSTNQYKGLEIVILCNSKDVFLTKVCVASIRYYYPDIAIHIVKDELQGTFSTDDLERYFHVQIMDLGLKKYGWCTGKIALFLANQYKGRKFLLLDSDIVFIGKVLDKILPELDQVDFMVSPEQGVHPEMDWFKRTYYRMDWALSKYPDHTYPGYSFNGGQMVVSPGVFTREELLPYIDLSVFPYWTPLAKQELPCLDQSLLNILFPLKHARGELRLAAVHFQLWSEAESTQQYTMEQIQGEGYPFLIHWAGAKRVADFSQMTRSDVMFFFKQYYFSKLPSGAIRLALDNYWQPWRYRVTQILKRFIK